jgi:hypothetical protein
MRSARQNRPGVMSRFGRRQASAAAFSSQIFRSGSGNLPMCPLSPAKPRFSFNRCMPALSLGGNGDDIPHSALADHSRR